ncbi:MAG: hypothetical protein KatS3mg061_1869 [Dehalococcoidia bacterium]|nr:MAG: hypothetical protein KatS3mg061_1869 [Dehalococcoidia bacterium]
MTKRTPPREPLEDLLVQQMATAYKPHLRWQARVVHRTAEETQPGKSETRQMLE